LNPARLPVPPQGHGVTFVFSIGRNGLNVTHQKK